MHIMESDALYLSEEDFARGLRVPHRRVPANEFAVAEICGVPGTGLRVMVGIRFHAIMAEAITEMQQISNDPARSAAVAQFPCIVT